MMAAVRPKNTKAEIIARKLISSLKLHYISHLKTLPGRPDFYLPDYSIAIFIHGCFWHKHPGCKYASTPKSNLRFWNLKLSGNVQRDRCVIKALRQTGIAVIVIWECELRKGTKKEILGSRQKILRKIQKACKLRTKEVNVRK